MQFEQEISKYIQTDPDSAGQESKAANDAPMHHWMAQLMQARARQNSCLWDFMPESATERELLFQMQVPGTPVSEYSERALPDALQAYVNRSLDFDRLAVRSNNKEYFIIRLVESGIKILTTAATSLVVEPVSAVAVRLDHAPREPARMQLEWPLDVGPVELMLFNSGHNQMEIKGKLPHGYSGAVVLSEVLDPAQDKTRILETLRLEAEQHFQFSALQPGIWQIALPQMTKSVLRFMLHPDTKLSQSVP
ncbi:MAG: hypothetical protein KDK39_14185 [Leptospiraceae bacterium]|nr:hypothetical protein [Leptospiraceae bacterium]